jgi:hypothetical protein
MERDMSEPRKATEVILDLESKIDVLLDTVRALDYNVKVLSNKLNEVMNGLKTSQTTAPKITVEAVQSPMPSQHAMVFGQIPSPDPQKSIPISAEAKLPMEEEPKGFRRTSRPESYTAAGDDVYLKKEGVPLSSNPASAANRPPPGRSAGDSVVVPTAPKNKAAPAPAAPKVPTEMNTHGIVPVEQRVVDRNGKSVFLADVEIMDLSSGEQVSKSRSNATGKWMAALPVGQYKVTIRKLESLTREKVEAIQTITVNGTESPLKLPVVIIKAT